MNVLLQAALITVAFCICFSAATVAIAAARMAARSARERRRAVRRPLGQVVALRPSPAAHPERMAS